METVRVKYVGSMQKVKANWTRKTYVFSKDNEFTLDVPEPLARELLMVGKYKVVPLTIPEQVQKVGTGDVPVNVDIKPIDKKPVGRPKKEKK